MAALLSENGIQWPLALKHSQHRVLSFNVSIGREVARFLIQALQRRPEAAAHNSRSSLRNSYGYVEIVHARSD